MSEASNIVITDAGLAEVINAESSGTAPVVLSHIAVGSGQYTATADMTKLKAEFKRFDAVTGGAVDDHVIHLTINDTSSDAYTVYEIGVFTAKGTLFAVYSQKTPITQKAAGAQSLLAIDIVLTNMNAESVSVGDMTFVLPPATTEIQGLVELADDEEVKAGTDTSRAVTPAGVQLRMATHEAKLATDLRAGHVKIGENIHYKADGTIYVELFKEYGSQRNRDETKPTYGLGGDG